jgi:hypothetical protein
VYDGKTFLPNFKKWAELFFRGTVLGFYYFTIVWKTAEKHGGFLPHP